jgi:phage shock protein A
MSKIEEIVDALENKISKILHKQEVLKQTNEKLTQKLQSQEQQLLQYQEEISEWSEKYETLKTVNSMLGSDENKRETKLKINALIRDIDHCIAQLSE